MDNPHTGLKAIEKKRHICYRKWNCTNTTCTSQNKGKSRKVNFIRDTETTIPSLTCMSMYSRLSSGFDTE